MSEQKHMGDMLTQKHKILDENPYSKQTYVANIFRLQKSFAGRFIPFDECAKDVKVRDQWTNELVVCIQDELCEILGWLPWKHWKDYKDYKMEKEEIRFEVIDVLHFLVNLSHVWGVEPVPYLLQPSKAYDYSVETQFSYKALMIEMTSSLMDLVEDRYDFMSVFEELFCTLRKMFGLFAMTDEDVYKYYTSKNQENYERQERGY